MNFLIRLFVTAAVAYGLSIILKGVHIPNFIDALILVIVLAVLNTFIKPILVLLTLPITIITMGLFLFVVNALIILLADKLMDGIRIDGFWWALISSLILSVASSVVFSIVEKKSY